MHAAGGTFALAPADQALDVAKVETRRTSRADVDTAVNPERQTQWVGAGPEPFKPIVRAQCHRRLSTRGDGPGALGRLAHEDTQVLRTCGIADVGQEFRRDRLAPQNKGALPRLLAVRVSAWDRHGDLQCLAQ